MPVAPPDPKEAVGRLLGFAGSRKKLAVLGCVLAGVNGVFVVMPLVCVRSARLYLVAVAPNWSAAEGLAFWGWLAFAFSATGLLVYFAALMCTHLAAFRTAANMRKQALGHLGRVPLGYFDSHASGHLRRVVDGCAGQTEDMLAHKAARLRGIARHPRWRSWRSCSRSTGSWDLCASFPLPSRRS